MESKISQRTNHEQMLIQSRQVESQVFATKKGVVNDLLHCQVSFEGVGRVNPSMSLCCPSLNKYPRSIMATCTSTLTSPPYNFVHP